MSLPGAAERPSGVLGSAVQLVLKLARSLHLSIKEEEEAALPDPESPSGTLHLPPLCTQCTYHTVFLH